MTTAPRPGAVLVSPDDSPTDPEACRIIARSMAHTDDWPWYRLTGSDTDLPPRHGDLSKWVPQTLEQVGKVLGT